jgi:phage baseplate assembly protein gpV
MSQERRKRQQEREGSSEPRPSIRKIALLVLVAAIAIGLYAFTRHRQSNRLNAFAQCLADKGAKMYGAYWCPHCADQKERFGDSFKYAPYVECGVKGSRTPAPACVDAGIKHYPTWVFADGSRVEGDHDLEFLSQATGCSLP